MCDLPFFVGLMEYLQICVVDENIHSCKLAFCVTVGSEGIQHDVGETAECWLHLSGQGIGCSI